jgi:LAO/AO transport system kinase
VRAGLTTDDYVAGVLAGQRSVLGRAITLVESERASHQKKAQDVLEQLLPRTGKAYRVGISGVPGVGKSTFIDALGSHLTSLGHRVAVLAVDPSSSVSGGSILGDKTRMPNLARDSHAYVRPSPSSGTLGGVARKTRESILVCEAAGFDVVLVETVGVGQSEVVVAEMVDYFVVLMLTGAGDELQGIKRGILEVADLIAVNKADGDNRPRAERARSEYQAALRLMRGAEAAPHVVLTSGRERSGLVELWQQVVEDWRARRASGELEAKRQRQQMRWMWRILEDRLMAAFRGHAGVRARLADLEEGVRRGETPASAAADELLSIFLAPPAS